MKQTRLLSLIAASAIAAFAPCAHATMTTTSANREVIKFYPLGASFLNDTNSQFPTQRDTYMQGLAFFGGNPIATGTRSNNVTGIEPLWTFRASDIIVTTPVTTTNCIWRGQLNPSNTNYAGQNGQRAYGGGIIVGVGQQISLNNISTAVIDSKGFFSSQSTYAGETYSPSRYGIIMGPSGQLFGNDHTILHSGESGATPVDAIVVIGQRIGADIGKNGQNGVDAVNAYVAGGDPIQFQYAYSGSTTNVDDTTTNVATVNDTVTWNTVVYADSDQLPPQYSGPVVVWHMPTGLLFSLHRSETDTFTTHTTRKFVTNTNGIVDMSTWPIANASATTGSSVEITYTGASSNDVGFFAFTTNSVADAPLVLQQHSALPAQPKHTVSAEVLANPTAFFQSSP